MNALLVSTGYSTPKAVLLMPRISKGPVKSEEIQSRIQLTSEVWNGRKKQILDSAVVVIEKIKRKLELDELSDPLV